MTEEEIAQAFNSYAEGKGINTSDLSLSHFPRLVIEYYQEVEFAEVGRADDGDMLLFQYGTYDWGEGRFFEVGFTRQFYQFFAHAEDHEVIQQSFTFYFDPKGFEQVASYDLWSRTIASIGEFEMIILSSDGYREAVQRQAKRFEISIDDAC